MFLTLKLCNYAKLNCLKSLSSSSRPPSMDLSGPFCHPSLSFIAPRTSSSLHSVSAQSCYIWVLAGCPAFACHYEGVNRSLSLLNSTLIPQQGPACLVRPTLIVYMIGGRCLYSYSFVGCCHQDLFSIARSILVYLPSSFFSIRLVSVHA